MCLRSVLYYSCSPALDGLTEPEDRNYYNKLEKSPFFAAAIIFHPTFEIVSLEPPYISEEQPAWVFDVEVGLKDYSTSEYDVNQGLMCSRMYIYVRIL